MKKLIKTFLILVILAGVMYITVPSPDSHREMAKDKLTERINKENTNAVEALGEKIFMNLVMTQLDVDDYIVCNIGHVTYDGEKHYISIGMFNHVFLIDKLNI